MRTRGPILAELAGSGALSIVRLTHGATLGNGPFAVSRMGVPSARCSVIRPCDPGSSVQIDANARRAASGRPPLRRNSVIAGLDPALTSPALDATIDCA